MNREYAHRSLRMPLTTITGTTYQDLIFHPMLPASLDAAVEKDAPEEPVRPWEAIAYREKEDKSGLGYNGEETRGPGERMCFVPAGYFQ